MMRSRGSAWSSARATVRPPSPESKTPSGAAGSRGPLMVGLDVLDAQDAWRAFEEGLALDRLDGAAHRTLAADMSDDAHGYCAVGLEGAAFLHHLLDADAFGAQRRSNVPEHTWVIADREAQ